MNKIDSSKVEEVLKLVLGIKMRGYTMPKSLFDKVWTPFIETPGIVSFLHSLSLLGDAHTAMTSFMFGYLLAGGELDEKEKNLKGDEVILSILKQLSRNDREDKELTKSSQVVDNFLKEMGITVSGEENENR